jgi:hypothetical protein
MPCACTRSPHHTATVRTSWHVSAMGQRRWPRPPQSIAAGGTHGRTAARLLEAVRLRRVAVLPPASASGRRSLATVAHKGVHGIIHLLLQVFYFFLITDRDCVALSYVDISTSTPPMDEVVVACPPGHNNNDAHGRAIYVGVIADPGGGTTHACSSSSSKLMIQVSAVRHDLQDVVPPQMLQSG